MFALLEGLEELDLSRMSNINKGPWFGEVQQEETMRALQQARRDEMALVTFEMNAGFQIHGFEEEHHGGVVYPFLSQGKNLCPVIESKYECMSFLFLSV